MKIEDMYDEWASSYDSVNNKTRDTEHAAIVNTLNSIEFTRVLELGCGTGKNTQYLSKRAKEVQAIDFSNEMLDIAKKKVNNDNVKFNKFDINQNWNLKTSYFDLVTASLVFEHINI